MQAVLKVTLIGFGAIGRSVCDKVAANSAIEIVSIVVPDPGRYAATDSLKASSFTSQVDYDNRPDVLVECAGHTAIEQHVLPALRCGIPCIMVSIGALSEPAMAERLERAAHEGRTSVQLLSGAIGGIDALAAARIGGLDCVRYEGRKPPLAWKGTPAETECALDAVRAPVCIFSGSAREAARLFPKNANVAATVALAGLGLDHTQVALYADPGITENHHRIEARGAFGNLELTLRGKPLAANPKTSALTVFSVVRALTNRVSPVAM